MGRASSKSRGMCPRILAGGKRVALLGTADSALAQRLSRELGISAPKQAMLAAGSLAQLRELLKTLRSRRDFSR